MQFHYSCCRLLIDSKAVLLCLWSSRTFFVNGNIRFSFRFWIAVVKDTIASSSLSLYPRPSNGMRSKGKCSAGPEYPLWCCSAFTFGYRWGWLIHLCTKRKELVKKSRGYLNWYGLEGGLWDFCRTVCFWWMCVVLSLTLEAVMLWSVTHPVLILLTMWLVAQFHSFPFLVCVPWLHVYFVILWQRIWKKNLFSVLLYKSRNLG